MGHTYFITGANRGIGLEFVRQLAGRGAGEVVIGTARNPDAAAELAGAATKVVPLDVGDDRSIAALRDHTAGHAIDVLINNAGVNSARTKSLEEMDVAELRRVFEINAISPVLVTRALLDRLRQGERKVIINISSQLASITNNDGGSSYGYRGSKAALNMLTTCMANELKGEGFICVAMHPGWVRTDMGGPNATLSPEESVGMMLKTIEQLRPEDTGRFLNYDGTGLPW